MFVPKIVTGLLPSQAARAVGLSTSRLRQLRLDGQVRVIQTPYGSLYTEDSIEALIARRQAKRTDSEGAA